MSNLLKAFFAAALLAGGLSATATAAPRRAHHTDPWVQQLHLDNEGAPAKQYFDEMQRDGN